MDKISKTVIGKHIIEILTSGMYDDSRFVYREYIQNSADAIDEAVRLGLFKSQRNGQIFITIDRDHKRIIFEDDATGIKSSDIVSVLKNIAASTKDKEISKGFRGIGRLGGLGYCDRLIFESSYNDEPVKNIMIWDAAKLKNKLHSKHEKIDAINLIDEVTEFKQLDEDAGKHYFRVILEDVNNDVLLNVDNIREYLEMVAPVPYHKKFLFADKIYTQIKELGLHLDEYNIYVEDEQIFKSYSTSIYECNGGSKKIDEVFDIEFFDYTYENELLVFGWYSISKFAKQIPESANPSRGIRLRKGNIQIGNEYAIVPLHKERRGNFYFFGEIHSFHKKLIPNGRRDYFEENDACKYFEKQLKELFHGRLLKLYNLGSKVRSYKSEIDKFITVKSEYEEKIKKSGFISKAEKNNFEDKLEKSKLEAEKAESNLKKIIEKYPDRKSPEKKIVDKVTKGITENIVDIELPNNKEEKNIKYATDDLSKLTKKERKLVSNIFVIINNALSKDLAENLIDKIKELFK